MACPKVRNNDKPICGFYAGPCDVGLPCSKGKCARIMARLAHRARRRRDKTALKKIVTEEHFENI
jgi:hypothetical protein